MVQYDWILRPDRASAGANGYARQPFEGMCPVRTQRSLLISGIADRIIDTRILSKRRDQLLNKFNELRLRKTESAQKCARDKPIKRIQAIVSLPWLLFFQQKFIGGAILLLKGVS